MHKYLSEIEKALDQIFQAIDFYNKLLEDLNPPVFSASISEAQNIDALTDKWIETNSDEIKANIDKERKYFAHVNSKYILCGSLLQIAFMGIKLYGYSHEIPENFIEIALKYKNSENTFKRFCCGRKIRGVPMGLIIYAGRNQYNHYDDSKLSPANTKIFEMLSKNHGLPNCQNIIDPVFDISNKVLPIYASNIIAILEWKSVTNFLEDMNTLLTEGV